MLQSLIYTHALLNSNFVLLYEFKFDLGYNKNIVYNVAAEH